MFIYNDTMYNTFTVDLNNRDIFVDFDAKHLVIKQTQLTTLKQNDFDSYVHFLQQKYITFFRKIKFIGKGFRLQSFRDKNIIEFTFGHSHIYISKMNFINYKRLGKYKYLLFTNNVYILNMFIQKLNRIKPINPYTLRGLRVSKWKILKRKGRKSPNL